MVQVSLGIRMTQCNSSFIFPTANAARGCPSGNHSRSSNIPVIPVTVGGAHLSNKNKYGGLCQTQLSARNVLQATVLGIMTDYKNGCYRMSFLKKQML